MYNEVTGETIDFFRCNYHNFKPPHSQCKTLHCNQQCTFIKYNFSLQEYETEILYTWTNNTSRDTSVRQTSDDTR